MSTESSEQDFKDDLGDDNLSLKKTLGSNPKNPAEKLISSLEPIKMTLMNELGIFKGDKVHVHMLTDDPAFSKGFDMTSAYYLDADNYKLSKVFRGVLNLSSKDYTIVSVKTRLNDFKGLAFIYSDVKLGFKYGFMPKSDIHKALSKSEVPQFTVLESKNLSQQELIMLLHRAHENKLAE